MARQGPLWLDARPGHIEFPDPALAMDEPDGLLAAGGDLSPERLLNAYRHGIFPWFSEGQPILWWSPNPRAVLLPTELKISRSLGKRLRRGEMKVTLNRAFGEVISACSEDRPGQDGTWITQKMKAAYMRLHNLGHAHSVESWCEGELVGGLYGIAIGRVFFGESMFTRRSDASKIAFAHLVRQLSLWGFPLIDCQVSSAHLSSLGAREIPRGEFLRLLDQHCDQPGPDIAQWQGELAWQEDAA